MKNTGKKPKISIMVRIIALFLAALMLSAAVTFALSYSFARENAAKEVTGAAEAVAAVVDATFGKDFSIKQLYEDEKEREYAHDVFRLICEQTGVRYLYLYTLDDNDYRHFIVSAVGNDEDDAAMKADFGF